MGGPFGKEFVPRSFFVALDFPLELAERTRFLAALCMIISNASSFFSLAFFFYFVFCFSLL